jgi:hypothetical protein
MYNVVNLEFVVLALGVRGCLGYNEIKVIFLFRHFVVQHFGL